MKTILARLKTLIQDSKIEGATLSYVKSVEVVHPEIGLTVHSLATFPRIVFTPGSTSEEWVASQEKQATHLLTGYLMLQYFQRESSIMGDPVRPSGQGKGILDFTIDFLDVVRGHRLAVDGVRYLDKPLDILAVEYIREDLGENAYLLVAAVQMQCTRLFLQTSLPGNV